MSYLVKPVGARELQRLFDRLQRQLSPALSAQGATTPLGAGDAGVPEAAALAGRQVLLVDDDVRNIYAMCALLGRFQLEVAVARHGEEALQLLEQHPVDLVFMDIAMPVMDGYTAIRILKEERHFQRPIIALTAHAMKGDREKCLAAGADDYLAKPVSSQTLKAMLDKWLVSTEVDHDAVS
jgi:CheY-like chemotaxis protein